ncbi:MAG: protein kinase domain-containing protein [Acidobacteriota bacterium]
MKYETGVPVGRGGMGEVVKAFDPTLGRHVALKTLRHQDPELTSRLLAEARAQALVNHPNVAKVYEVGQLDDGRAFIAMQFIEGAPLDVAARALAVEQNVLLVKTVAEAVHAAHATGLVHRDLKPGNIIVETLPEGGVRPYVLDFGIAREHDVAGLTRTGQILGTPGYMAPEQARGEVRAVDRRADVFSLGIILYEVLGGEKPFKGESSIEVLLRTLDSEPAPLRRVARHLPADLETITMKCLEKEPERRYQTARALAEDLSRFLAGDPILAHPPSFAYRALRRARKNRLAVALGLAAAIAVAAMGTIAVVTQLRSRERARLAQEFGQQAERIDARIRTAHLLPLHDITAEKAAVRELVAQIESRMERLGPLAEGVGRLALGRIHLANRDLPRAREELERSWRAGWRTADGALALSRVYAELFRQALERAARQRDAGAREALRRDAEERLREPALRYLSEASALGAPLAPFVEGLVASLGGDYDLAVAKAREAQRSEPAFYEARLFEGDLTCLRATDLLWKSEYGEAAALARSALASFVSAAETGRSDPLSYVGQCRAWSLEVAVDNATGASPDTALGEAVAACEKALAVDPSLAEPRLLIGQTSITVGQYRQRRGVDAGPAVDRALAEANAVLAADPKHLDALTCAGTAWMLRAEQAQDQAREAGEMLDRAVGFLQRATALHPDQGEPFHLLGNALINRAEDEQQKGRDPTPTMEEAVRSLERALEHPSTAVPRTYNSLGVVLTDIAVERRRRGLSGIDVLTRAEEALRTAVRLGPAYLSAHNSLGLALWERAEHEWRAGVDPERSFDEAERAFAHIIATDPTRGAARTNLAALLNARAGHRLRDGADPTAFLERAREVGATTREDYQWEYHIDGSETELLAARWALREGLPAERYLNAALARSAAAVRLFPDSPEAFRVLAESHRRRVEWMLSRGAAPADVRAEIERGLTAVHGALALTPAMGAALAHRAALEWSMAEVATSREDARRRRESARASWAAARRDSPGLIDDVDTRLGATVESAAGSATR